MYTYVHTFSNSAPRNNKRRASLINYLSANYCNYMLPHPFESSRLFSPLQRALNPNGKDFMTRRQIFLCFTIIISKVIFIIPYLVVPSTGGFSFALNFHSCADRRNLRFIRRRNFSQTAIIIGRHTAVVAYLGTSK